MADDLIKATDLLLWDVDSGQQIHRFVGQEGMITGVAFAPDGKTLASSSDDASIMLWDTKTGAELPQFAGHGNEVFAVAFSPDGRIVASGSQDRTVRLWDATSGREVRRLGTRGPVRSLAFRPDGRVLASGGGVNQPDRSGTHNFAEVRLWDVSTGRELRQLSGHRAGVRFVAFAPDGASLATASPAFTEQDAAIRIWDAATGRELRRFGADIQGFLCEGLTFSPDGALLGASIPGSLIFWSVGSGEIHRRISLGGGISAIAFRPDGKTLAAKYGDREAALRFWDLASGRSFRDLALPQWSGLNSVTFSPDGALVAAAYASTIQVWEADTGREVGRFEGRPGRIHSIAFAPDGKRLASGHADASVMIWDVADLPGFRGPRP